MFETTYIMFMRFKVCPAPNLEKRYLYFVLPPLKLIELDTTLPAVYISYM